LTDFCFRAFALLATLLLASACVEQVKTLPMPAPEIIAGSYANAGDYRIGPGDTLSVIVWHNSELTTTLTVRPDGRISMPLVGEAVAAGRTPIDVGKELQDRLKPYVKDPLVTVTPTQFVGPFTRQVRIVGEAVQPRAIPYTANMTVLDVMIAAGGLTKYADGDRAEIIRTVLGVQQVYRVHLDSLIRDGDITANVSVHPGDILIIPQRFF